MPTSPLARCPVDGVPLLLVVGYGGVVVIGCELCNPALARLARLPRPTCFAEAVRSWNETMAATSA